MAATANWNYPDRHPLRRRPRRRARRGRARRGIARPLFVTDPGIAPLPIAARALDALARPGSMPAVFSGVQPNPTEANVAAGLAVCARAGTTGSSHSAAARRSTPARSSPSCAGRPGRCGTSRTSATGGPAPTPPGIAPVVAVPTTAGTGSEVGRAGVITNLATRTKKVIFHPRMMPAQVILDPELTVGLPPALTAGTGMDAFAHCLEAYASPSYHPMAEGIAVEGLRLCKDYLPRAYRDGGDLEARGNMLAAAAMGATAFQKGLGAIHALSHPVGALYDTHHGLTNAVFMPYVLDFNREALWDKIDRLAAWLGIEGGFPGFLDFILRFRRDLGIPHTLDRIGVDDAASRRWPRWRRSTPPPAATRGTSRGGRARPLPAGAGWAAG